MGRFASVRVLGAAAMATSLAHVLIDHDLGLYGDSSSSMALTQFLNIAGTCALVAWWAVCLAASDERGLPGALALASVWAFLGNGLAALFLAPPPADAYPYQDLVHVANVVVGGWATYATLREVRRRGARVRSAYLAVAVGLLVANVAIEGIVSARYA